MWEVYDNVLGLGDTQMSLAIDSNQIVGGVPVYRIAGAPPNSLITWTSNINGASTSENNDYGQYTDADGVWTGAGGAWEPRHIGNWSKTAIVGGKSATVSFNVQPAPSSSGSGGTTTTSGGTNVSNTTTTTTTSDDVLQWVKDHALALGLGAAALLLLPKLLENFGGGKRGR